MVAVVVPFRPGCPHRERAWAWLRQQYANFHPDFEVIEARAPAGQWCKAAALNPAIEATEAEIIVQADADVWPFGLEEAIAAVRAGAPWAIPHQMVHRLDEQASEAVIAGGDWTRQRLEQASYCGVAGGGVLVARRETLLTVPLDSRFLGWGNEDESHAMALNTVAGERWRGTGDLIHLWHPPQVRPHRRRGSQESWDLRYRYSQAVDDPAAMAALIEEGRRVHSPSDEHRSKDHPALSVG
jgi:hypothetical protein